jgi:hypothetical protein
MPSAMCKMIKHTIDINKDSFDPRNSIEKTTTNKAASKQI